MQLLQLSKNLGLSQDEIVTHEILPGLLISFKLSEMEKCKEKGTLDGTVTNNFVPVSIDQLVVNRTVPAGKDRQSLNCHT